MRDLDEILAGLRDAPDGVPEPSDARKARYLEKTLKKIEAPHKKVLRPVFRRMAAAAAALVAVLGITAAAAEIFHWDIRFYNYFRVSDAAAVIVAGEELNEHDTCRGITVTARQVIGDDHGFYVLFDVNGKTPDISDSTFENVEVELPDAGVYQVSDMIMTACESPEHMSFMLHVTSAEELAGKKIIVKLGGFGKWEYGENYKSFLPSVKNGNWKLSWRIGYTSDAVTTEVGKPVSVYGGTAVWQSVSLTPVSVSVRLSDLKVGDIHAANANDQLTVTLLDGRRFRSDYARESDVLSDTDFLYMSFGRIVDPRSVASVTFAGETMVLNGAAGAQARETYNSEKMGFTVTMSPRLYAITRAAEQDGLFIDSLKENYDICTFTGTVDGVDATLFSVLRIDGIFDEAELEEKMPMDVFLGYGRDSTYMVEYGEIVDEAQLDKFVDIFNEEVSKILEYIDITEGLK